MEWLKKASQGWVVGTLLFASPVFAEPQDSLYTALLQIADGENPPLSNDQIELGPPVAPDLELPQQQELPALEAVPGPPRKTPVLVPQENLSPSSEVLPLELVPADKLPQQLQELPSSERETIYERYPNGAVKIERQVIQDQAGNYIHDGMWRWMSSKGQVIAEGEFSKGLRVGAWRRMYRKEDSPVFNTSPYRDFQAPFLSEAFFENGELHGPWMIADSQNRKISEINFEKGVRVGPAAWWHVQGTPMIQANFESGELHGDVFTFNAAGKTVSQEHFDRGQKLEKKTEKYANGTVKSVSTILSGHWKLAGKDDWWTASLSKFEIAGEPLKHGKVIHYHPNGNVKSEQSFVRGKPVGQTVWWHPNGQKALFGSYNEEGVAAGRWTWWHDNGLKSIEGDYLAGAPVGKWLAWDKNGRVSVRSSLEESGSEVIATKPSSGITAKNEAPTTVPTTRLGTPRPAAD